MGTPAWIVAAPDDGAADLAAAVGLHPLTAALLRRRGIVTPAEAHRFLHPRLEDLAAPESLPGMPDGVDRVARAIASGERIAVHGDYDVDGISATAILLRGLRALGAEPLWYLPHRLHDGYGLGARAVEALAAQGAQFLIAVDCGITAVDAIACARARGLDVLVLDHHTPSADRPAAIIVEPGPAGTAKQQLDLQKGIAVDRAREIVKLVKDAKLKVQAAIQGEQVRISGKKRDDLQAVIQMLRAKDLDLAMQFVNFRE